MAASTPVWKLWGGKVRDEMRLYANGWYQVDRDPEVFAQKAIEVVDMGYTALKFDPFGAARGVEGLQERQFPPPTVIPFWKARRRASVTVWSRVDKKL